MTMPLIVVLVLGALAVLALVVYANRNRGAVTHHATAQPGTDGYVPMVFGDSSSTTADCGSDGGAGCGDGGGGGGGD